MSRSFSMPTRQVIRVSLNGNLAHRMILTVLLTALATLPFWLGLEWVHSAPIESPAPPAARSGPPPGPTPSVTLDVPDEVLIGDTFKFQVTFTPGNVVGFGPFVDLVIPRGGTNYTAATGPCDGITFIKAEMIGVNGGPVPLTSFPAAAPPCTTSPTPPVCETLPHPFAASGISTILVPPGSQLFTIKLPFGSFQANQPPITIQVTASLSSLANVNVPLNIYARAGYQFGGDASNNFTTDPPVLSPGGVTDCSTWDASAPVTPVLFTFKVEDPLTNSGPCYDGIDNGSDNLTDSKDPDCKHAKTYIGPEDETATGPNFPRQYKITLDIAAGQTVNNLTVQDCLPNNIVFTGIGIGTAPSPVPVPSAPTGPLNNNCVSFNYASIVGTSLTDDIVIFVNFYVPQPDANGNQVLDPATCSNATSPNDVKASGNWTPTDPRDAATTVTSDMATVDHLLTDKRIAMQKSVETYPVPNAPLIPGGVLKYTLNFQVSDFFTVGHIVVTDVLSDGQDLITSPAGPKLIVSDRRGTNPTVVPFSSGSNFLNVPNAFVNCGGVHGGRSLVFQVSTAMQNNAGLFTDPVLQQGILTGGWAFTPTSSIPATGQIEFYAVVRDTFIHNHPTGDQYVDKEDPINNCVTISADIHTNHAILPVPKTPQLRCSDHSATALAIVSDTLKKSVYAIRRGSNLLCGPGSINGACSLPPAAPEVRPGDNVTFRIEKTIPSGDAEKLIVEDWLPQPIFNVTGTVFNNAPCTGIPLAGHACLGPTDQLHLAPISAAPTFSAITATNSLKFDYGNFFYTANLPRKIDLLFTHTVTNLPFADGLHLTNEVQECENNTFAQTFCQAAIAPVTLREPNLRVRKGVIATNNPNALFSQPGPPPTANLATALAPPNATLSLAGMSSTVSSSPMVTSNNLATGLLDSDLLGGVDANDVVTFAITIENQGGHPAYNAKLEDILPTCFTALTNLSNVVVKRGTGAVVNPLLYTLFPTGTGFRITSHPLAPISAYHPTSGANIIVITFQARLKADVTPGCCKNVAELEHYASQNGGPNFVSAGFTPPFEDPAEVCVRPTLTKSLVTTSEAHTAGANVTIGEIVRYRLVTALPEGGLLTNFQVIDALPSGLKFLNDGTARLAFISNGPGISHPSFPPPLGPPWNVNGNGSTLPGLTFSSAQTLPPTAISGGAACGAPVAFNLGNIQNNENDNDLEYIVIEFNALVCNVAGNQDGTTLTNTFSVSVNGSQIATSNPINLVIVEPNFTMSKTVAPNPANVGQTLTYTVKYTNTGTADAFDVELQDTLPTGLTLGTITAGCPFTTPGSNTLTVTCAQISKAPNPGSTVIITYQALASPASCPVNLKNQASLKWTSLPGTNGTLVNQTGSSTPGNSGLGDGERDGVTVPLAVNDYATSALAPVKIDCPCNATINGLKFHDLNGNGVRDSGEPGLANWTIKVADSSGNTQTTTTDSQGNYSLTVPAPATYTVSEVLQSGWTQTSPTTGTYTVTVSPGQIVNNRDFGNQQGIGGCVPPPPGMVGWWPMDDPTGDTIVNDIAGSPDNGSPKPGPAVGPASPSSVPAVVGTGLNFLPSISPTGPNHYVEVPTSSETNFGTGDFAIDAWVKLAQSANIHPIVEKYDFSTPGTNKGYAFFVQGGHLILRIGPDVFGGLVAAVSTGPAMTAGSWHHVAVAVRRNDPSNKPVITFYVNGVLSGSGPPAGPLMPGSISIDGTTSLLIGGKSRGQSGGAITSMAEIAIDELEFFKREITQTEIQRIFDAKGAGKCKCLAATNEKISCNPNGTFTYHLTVTNFSNSTVSNLVFSPNISNVTITPASIPIPPLAPGSSTNVTVTISGTGAVSGASVCFSIGLTGGGGVAGCRVQRCITLPACHKGGSLTVTKKVKNLLPFPFPPATNFPITVSCLPSGPNVTVNLTDGSAQTLNNIPIGSTCTVTEGALPPPIAHPACASVGWGTPTYSPGQTVTIPSTGGSQTVTVINTYSCSSTSSCATPPPGMVGWWPLDETSGSVIHSIVGNHDGTTLSGPIGGNISVATAPKVGGALFFGAGMVEVPDDPALNFGIGNFSIDAWVRSYQSTLLSAVVDKLDTTVTPRRGYAFFVQHGKVQLVMANGATTSTFQSSNAFAADGTWRHVAVTVRRVSGTPVGQFYIDGAPAGAPFSPLPGNIDSKAKLLIGHYRLSNSGCSCEVSLDEIELFNTVLSPNAIKSIFQADKNGKCKSTISGLKFHDLNGNGVRDTGEPGLQGWTIKNTDSAGNTQATITDSQGKYSIAVIKPGTYMVSEVNEEGWSPTTRDRSVTLASNQSAEVNFGNISVRRRDPFTLERGMNEFCFWGNGGPYNSPRPIDNPNMGFINNLNSTPAGNTSGSRFGAIGLCYGRILYANDTIALKYAFNATPVAVLSYPDVNPVFVDRGFPVPVSYTHRNVFGNGLSPLGLQLYFRPQSRVKPFVNTSVGFLFFKDPIPRLNGTRFNFTYDFGGGVQVFRDSRRAFSFGYKHQRLSNSGGALNYQNLNGNVFSFGYSIFK